MHVLFLINLLNCLIFTIFELHKPHLELDVGDIDLNKLLQGGIYDYLKNLGTWLMIGSCSNYLNFLLYTPL